VISEIFQILIKIITKIKLFLGATGFLTPEAIIVYLIALLVNMWRLPNDYRKAQTKALLFKDPHSRNYAKKEFNKFLQHLVLTCVLMCFCTYVLYFEYRIHLQITRADFLFYYYGTVPTYARTVRHYYSSLICKPPVNGILKFGLINFLVGTVLRTLFKNYSSREYFKRGDKVIAIRTECIYILVCILPSIFIWAWSDIVIWTQVTYIYAYFYSFIYWSVIAFIILILFERFQVIRWSIRIIKLPVASGFFAILVGLSDYYLNYFLFAVLWTMFTIVALVYLKEKGVGLLGKNGFGLEDFNNNFVSNAITGERPGLDIIKVVQVLLSANFQVSSKPPGLGATRELRYFYYQCKYKRIPWKIFFIRILDVLSAAISFVLPAVVWSIFMFLSKDIQFFFEVILGLLFFCLIFNFFRNRK